MGVYLWTDTAYIPTANTLAYFPFIENQNDIVGNYTISTTWTKQTIWFAFTGNTWLQYSDYISEKFISCWFRVTSSARCAILLNNYWGFRLNWLNGGESTKHFTMKNSGGNFYDSSALSLNTDTRYYLTYWVDSNNNFTAWINWVSQWSITQSPATYSSSSLIGWTATWSVIFSDLIIENTKWTADQVTAYFNKTKSRYWIS